MPLNTDVFALKKSEFLGPSPIFTPEPAFLLVSTKNVPLDKGNGGSIDEIRPSRDAQNACAEAKEKAPSFVSTARLGSNLGKIYKQSQLCKK